MVGIGLISALYALEYLLLLAVVFTYMSAFYAGLTRGSYVEKDPAIRNKGSVDIFSGSFNFQTVNP